MEIKLFGYHTFSKTFVLNSEEMSLDKVILNENRFYSRYKEGLTFFENGDYNTALDIFFDVIILSRDFSDPYIMIGLCYSKIPEFEYEGIEWIKKGIEKTAEKMKGYKSLYEVYFDIEDYKAALNTLKKIETLEESEKIEDWIQNQMLNLKGKGYL